MATGIDARNALDTSHRRVIFASNIDALPSQGRAPNFDLYVVDPDAPVTIEGVPPVERITYYEGFDGFPMFSPSGELLVFASNAGADHDPDWYRNVRADPRVTVEVGTETFEGVALPVEGEERDRLYARQGDLVPAYAEYQRKTSRPIPVVALHRARLDGRAWALGDELVRIHDDLRAQLAPQARERARLLGLHRAADGGAELRRLPVEERARGEGALHERLVLVGIVVLVDEEPTLVHRLRPRRPRPEPEPDEHRRPPGPPHRHTLSRP